MLISATYNSGAACESADTYKKATNCGDHAVYKIGSVWLSGVIWTGMPVCIARGSVPEPGQISAYIPETQDMRQLR